MERTKKFKNMDDAIAFASDYFFDGMDEDDEEDEEDEDSFDDADSDSSSVIGPLGGKFAIARAAFEEMCRKKLQNNEEVTAGIGEEEDILEQILEDAKIPPFLSFSCKMYLTISPNNFEITYNKV